MIPKPFRALSKGVAIVIGGFLTLNLAGTVAIVAVRSVAEKNRVKDNLPRPPLLLIFFYFFIFYLYVDKSENFPFCSLGFVEKIRLTL